MNKINKLLSQRYLKFGCPKHDLATVLLDNGFELSNDKEYILCNNYSPMCLIDNGIDYDNLFEVQKWSFPELGIGYTGRASIDAALEIVFNKVDVEHQDPNIGGKIELLFDILRTDEAAFVKRFRPGYYDFNGTNTSKQMGTWVCH